MGNYNSLIELKAETIALEILVGQLFCHVLCQMDKPLDALEEFEVDFTDVLAQNYGQIGDVEGADELCDAVHKSFERNTYIIRQRVKDWLSAQQ